MFHDLPHLAARLYGKPLMLARGKLETILAAIGPRLAGLAEAPLPDSVALAPAPQVLDSGVAILPILGTLVTRSAYLGAASGLTSYAEIAAQAEALFADPAVRAVVMEIDSPGGEAGGVFDLAERLARLARESGKPLWAVASESALSAAYAIAAAAERIFVTSTGETGSVGVVAVHVDQSAADAQAGLHHTFVYAGDKKIDGNPHQPLSPSARADLARDVEALYSRFVAWVADRRRLSESAVRAQQAAVFRGADAVSVGLADAVGTLRDLVAALESRLSTTPAAAGRALKGGLAMTHEEAVATSAAAEALDPETLKREALAHAAEIVEIAEQARALGVAIDAAAAIRDGIAPDALRAHVLKEAAERDRSMNIVAHAPHADAPTVSPLIAAARQFAKKGA